jgi:hypothetical protein
MAYSEPPWLLDFLPAWGQVGLGGALVLAGGAIMCWGYSHQFRQYERGAILVAASSMWILAGLAAMLHPLR